MAARQLVAVSQATDRRVLSMMIESKKSALPKWMVVMIKYLPTAIFAWCAFNLLWSLTNGSWKITFQRIYATGRGSVRERLDFYWEACRCAASGSGDLIISWPLIPNEDGYSKEGLSMSAYWALRPNGWASWPTGCYVVSSEWPSWIASGHGFSWHGLLFVHQPELYYRNYRGIAVPWWMLTLVMFPFAVARLAGPILRLKRRRRGLCEQCGYDLRATPGQCPECGLSVQRRISASDTRGIPQLEKREAEDRVISQLDGKGL